MGSSSDGRASASQAEGRGFDPHLPLTVVFNQFSRLTKKIKAMNNVSATRIVKTAANDQPVNADIAIGFGQRGDTIIYIDGQKFLEFEDSRSGIQLGTNNSLKQKLVVFQTMVYDIQKQTNQTSMDITVLGAQSELKIPMSFTVPSEGDVVSYTANINFI